MDNIFVLTNNNIAQHLKWPWWTRSFQNIVTEIHRPLFWQVLTLVLFLRSFFGCSKGIVLFSGYQMNLFSPKAIVFAKKSKPDLPGSVNIFCRDPLYNLFFVEFPVQKCTELHPPCGLWMLQNPAVEYLSPLCLNGFPSREGQMAKTTSVNILSLHLFNAT